MKFFVLFISTLVILQFLFFSSIIVDAQIVKQPQLYLGPTTEIVQLESRFDYNNLTANASLAYNRYDFSFLRFHIRNNQTKFDAYSNFHPRVDEFTTLKIPSTQFIYEILQSNRSGDYSNGVAPKESGYSIYVELPGMKNISTVTSVALEKTTPCTITLANGTVEVNTVDPACIADPLASFQEKYINTTTTYTMEPLILPAKRILNVWDRTFVGFFTLIVQLDAGRIIDAQWDGDKDTSICDQCDSCIDNQCAVNYDDMNCDVDNGCQLKIFVAWVGVDTKGVACRSINKIPSQFQKYSSTALKKMGTGLLSDFFYKVNDAQNNPNQA